MLSKKLRKRIRAVGRGKGQRGTVLRTHHNAVGQQHTPSFIGTWCDELARNCMFHLHQSIDHDKDQDQWLSLSFWCFNILVSYIFGRVDSRLSVSADSIRPCLSGFLPGRPCVRSSIHPLSPLASNNNISEARHPSDKSAWSEEKTDQFWLGKPWLPSWNLAIHIPFMIKSYLELEGVKSYGAKYWFWTTCGIAGAFNSGNVSKFILLLQHPKLRETQDGAPGGGPGQVLPDRWDQHRQLVLQTLLQGLHSRLLHRLHGGTSQPVLWGSHQLRFQRCRREYLHHQAWKSSC